MKQAEFATWANLDQEIEQLESEAKSFEAEARELNGKAQAIEDAVYDLKAVNPNAKSAEDTQTPAELIAFIEAKGREVAEALATLKGNGERAQ